MLKSKNQSNDIRSDRTLAAYDYELSEERIARDPAVPRDSSRLLVVESSSSHSHRVFRDLPEILEPGDLLVLNNTRVIPARLYGRKSTGAPVEVLLLEELETNIWLTLVKPGKRLKPGAWIYFKPLDRLETEIEPIVEEHYGLPSSSPTIDFGSISLRAEVLAIDEPTGGRILRFDSNESSDRNESSDSNEISDNDSNDNNKISLLQVLEQYGRIPFPPYIKNSQATAEQYQTIYARESGSAAAPTAGLHFTENLLARLEQKGIDRAFVTLHVGVGTFRPVEVENILNHKMHGEWVEVPRSTVEKINETKARGGRIIAVGTTVVRSLEGAAASGNLESFCGKTDLFIYPGYQWRVVEGLITNFHLPRSSLLMLVSALVGRRRLLDLYREAIARQYRFYSFGDAMLILPEANSGPNT